MIEFIWAVIAAVVIVISIFAAFAYTEKNSDGHYVPSEAAKQAQADQARLVREINSINYSRPLNQPTENS